jgi:DNA-binding XRE family transcriptional regulator
MLTHGTRLVGSRANPARLTEVQVIEIRQRLSAGESQTRLAREFGVTKGAVSHINTGRNWFRG